VLPGGETPPTLFGGRSVTSFAIDARLQAVALALLAAYSPSVTSIPLEDAGLCSGTQLLGAYPPSTSSIPGTDTECSTLFSVRDKRLPGDKL
jgi:hypothetical protein